MNAGNSLDKTAVIASRPWRHIQSCSDGVVPCMLTHEEKSMLEWLGRHFARAGSALCDLGAFAGGSTAALATGLRQASLNAEVKVHSFDFFEIPEARKQRMLYRHGFPEFAGSDFLPTVRNRLSSLNDFIVYHKGDFLAATWNLQPISVLHVDISKSYQLNTHILNEFFVCLQPSVSILVQQDYQHWSNPWVAATMELLRDYFELLTWTEDNAVIFGCTRPLPKEIGTSVERELKRPACMRKLLKDAFERFPEAKQRAAIAKSFLAFEANPGVEKAWQFRLELAQGSSPIALAGW